MKTATSLAVATSLAASIATAAPMVSVGDNVDIFFNLSTSIKADDNITSSPSNELDDTIFTVTPGIEVDFFRGQTLWDAVLTVDNQFVRYSDNDQFDVENLGVSLVSSYSSPILNAQFNVAYGEDQQKTQQVAGSLIEVESIVLGANVRYEVTEKIAVGITPRFTQQDYVGVFGATLPDKDTVSLGLKGFYAISPKYDLAVGLNYRDQDIDDLNGNVGRDPEDYRLTVGVEGELLPKLTGFLDVGFTERSFRNGNRPDRETFFIDVDLSWAVTQKISMNLGLRQDFDSTAAGNAIESSTASLQARYSINNFWRVAPFVRFIKDDYVGSDRQDEVTNVGLNVGYTANAFLSFAFSAYYVENDSTLPQDYDNSVVQLSASLRY